MTKGLLLPGENATLARVGVHYKLQIYLIYKASLSTFRVSFNYLEIGLNVLVFGTQNMVTLT